MNGVQKVLRAVSVPVVLLLIATSVLVGCQRQSGRTRRNRAEVSDSQPAASVPRVTPPSKGAANVQESTALPQVLFDAPRFRLTDQNGNSFGTEQLRGHVWVANFIFTHCTATCPQQTAKIAELQQIARRWPDWERIRLVSFTVDPKRDTPARLHEYAETHYADHTHWRFLTGPRNELFDISKTGFKLPVSEAARDKANPIMHSSKFILIDHLGHVRGYYDSDVDSEQFKLLNDMRAVLAESVPGVTAHLGFPPHVFYPIGLEQRRAAQLATAGKIGAYHDFQFSDQVKSSGITFVNRAVADAARDFKFNHYDHANGVAVADVDGDGLLDIYFVSQVGRNEMWRNLGNGRFEDITDAAGVALADRVGVTASFADTDNDGDPDLLVTSTRQGNTFFENDGKGHFRDITQAAGLEYQGHSSSIDFFDYDRDGRVDIFLTNVGIFTTNEVGYSGAVEQKEFPYFIGQEQSFAGHLYPEQSERSILYHNDGENRFHDASLEVGLVHDFWSGDATPIDVNEDGWIDLYVATMQGEDQYYENLQGKQFVNRGPDVFPKAVWGGMGLKSFDYNNDGHMDLYITNMHADMWDMSITGPREKLKAPSEKVPPKSFLHSRDVRLNVFGNALYEATGPGHFKEVSDQTNAENYWPWGLSVGDLNADGFQDVFITSSMNMTYPYHPNTLLLNDGGKRFQDAEFIVGVEPRRDGRTASPWYELDCSGADAKNPLASGRTGKLVVWGAVGSRSSAIFDIDQDGDLDIVTNDFNTEPMVLTSNLAERQPNLSYLKIKLRGTRTNRDGLGARVQVKAGGRILTQVNDGQSGYLSQSVMPLYFGLNQADSVEEITVQWPGRKPQVLSGPISKNQQLEIVEED